MGYPWKIHGLPMENPWVTHGKSMGYPWKIHGLPMENPWVTHGKSTGYPWKIHGLPMENPRVTHGKSMGYPWKIHGLPMENPWVTHGKSMGYPWIYQIPSFFAMSHSPLVEFKRFSWFFSEENGPWGFLNWASRLAQNCFAPPARWGSLNFNQGATPSLPCFLASLLPCASSSEIW